jgi:hypothetical protein
MTTHDWMTPVQRQAACLEEVSIKLNELDDIFHVLEEIRDLLKPKQAVK